MGNKFSEMKMRYKKLGENFILEKKDLQVKDAILTKH